MRSYRVCHVSYVKSENASLVTNFFICTIASLLFGDLLLGEVDGGGAVGCTVGDLNVGEKVGAVMQEVLLSDCFCNYVTFVKYKHVSYQLLVCG